MMCVLSGGKGMSGEEVIVLWVMWDVVWGLVCL